MSHITNLLKSQKPKPNYVGPLTISGHVVKSAPFKVKFLEEQLGPMAREAIDIFKGVDLPGTEGWLYPRRSLTWDAKNKEWHAINTLGSGDNTLVAIPLRDWLQDAGVMHIMDDPSKVASFKWYHDGQHIAEAEAVVINDQFDVSTYGAQAFTSPVRKRSFDPVAANTSDVASPSQDVNRLLNEGTPEAADSVALLLATQQSKRARR